MADFRVGGGSGEEGGSNGGVDPQASVRAELEQLKQRVAQLESQLGVKKQRGLNFTVRTGFRGQGTMDGVLSCCICPPHISVRKYFD